MKALYSNIKAHHNAVGTNAYIVFVGGYIGIVCPREL